MARVTASSEPRPYPEGSGLNDAPGYYFSLTNGERGVLDAMEARLRAEGQEERAMAHVLVPAETLKTYLLRYLRARDFDLDKSYEFLMADLEWREAEDIDGLARMSVAEVLECNEKDAKTILSIFPSFVHGHDKAGQSIMYRHYGKFEIWKILEYTTIKNLLRLHVWENEQALRALRTQASAMNASLETFCAVIDAQGWRLGYVTSDAMQYVRGMVNVDSDHYPERLGRMVIINLPYMLSTFWNVVKRWLGARTRDKIQLLASKSAWQPVLRKFIDAEFIPKQYGGLGPNSEMEAQHATADASAAGLEESCEAAQLPEDDEGVAEARDAGEWFHVEVDELRNRRWLGASRSLRVL